MDGPVFDAMLKTALEEALRQDIEEAPAAPPPSRRQKRRMKQMLANPRSYARQPSQAQEARRVRNPARWLAAVVIAALLTGTAAAGFALGSGEWFRQRFENSFRAGDYGDAVDTEQLLNLGVEMNAALAESDGLRFEMLDAVFDGQTALIAVQMTVLDPALLDLLQEAENIPSPSIEITTEDGAEARSWGCSIGEAGEPGSGQYSMEISITDEALGAGGRYDIHMTRLHLFPSGGGDAEILRQGDWTLSVTLPPMEVLRLEPGRVCHVAGVDWVLDSLTLSPLALQMSFHRLDGESRHQGQWYPYKDLAIHLKDGGTFSCQGSTTGISSGGSHADISIEFPMPLDLEQVEYIHIGGEDFYFE